MHHCVCRKTHVAHTAQYKDTRSMTQRREQRLKAAFNACYCRDNDQILHPCRIVDISRFGSRIALISKHALESGSRIALHIELPGCDRRIVARFTCVWTRCTPDTQDSGVYEAGGFFTEVNSEGRNLLLSRAEMSL